MKVKLSSKGIEEVLLRSEVGDALQGYAEQIANSARQSESVASRGIEVGIGAYTAQGGRLKGARQARAVTILHPAGLAIEAKHGTLTSAALAAGLEVNGDGGGDGSELVDYVTKSGKKRKATKAQVANWTRGSSK